AVTALWLSGAAREGEDWACVACSGAGFCGGGGFTVWAEATLNKTGSRSPAVHRRVHCLDIGSDVALVCCPCGFTARSVSVPADRPAWRRKPPAVAPAAHRSCTCRWRR